MNFMIFKIFPNLCKLRALGCEEIMFDYNENNGIGLCF